MPLGLDHPVFVDAEVATILATVVSCRDRLDIGIVGDAEAVPDTWDLIADIRTELTELVELTTTGRSTD